MGVTPQRDPLSFLPGVAEKLGWYVYALRDLLSGAIFYVGKGVGNRVYLGLELLARSGYKPATSELGAAGLAVPQPAVAPA